MGEGKDALRVELDFQQKSGGLRLSIILFSVLKTQENLWQPAKD